MSASSRCSCANLRGVTLLGTRVTQRIEVGNDEPDLFIGHLATKALEDRLQGSGAHILHGVGNRSICLWVDPRFQSIRAMILDELCEVAPSRTDRAAGSRCDLFHAGTVGKQFKGGLF